METHRKPHLSLCLRVLSRRRTRRGENPLIGIEPSIRGELSVHQYASGDGEKAASLLKQVQEMAHKIHLTMSEDNKRLKNAQILLRHTAFRLNEMLHNSSLEDQPLVAATLAQVNQAQDEAMLQVFRK